MKNNLVLGLLAIASIALGLWFGLQQQPESTNPYAKLGGDFELPSDQGPFRLADHRGRIVVLYFGYTACPDVCITSLNTLNAAMDMLSEDEQKEVTAAFISVDVERDDAAKAGQYARYFRPSFVGLSGDADYTAEIAKRYGVFYEKVQMTDSAMGYTVDHSSYLYIIGKDGKINSLARHGDTPSTVAEHIRKAVKS